MSRRLALVVTCLTLISTTIACKARDTSGLASEGGRGTTNGRPTISCSIADQNGANSQDIQAQIVQGAVLPASIPQTYRGKPVAVVFNEGSAQESQQLLSMSIGDSYRQVFDPGQALYKLSAGNATLQCFVQMNGGPTGTLPEAPSCLVAKDGANRQTVAVTTIAGAQVADPIVTTYNGRKISVVFNEGGAQESQQYLSMSLGGDQAETFDPRRSLYKLGASDGTEVQCFFGDADDAVPEPAVVAETGVIGDSLLSCTIAKDGANQVTVTPSFVSGAALPEDNSITYQGRRVSVTFNEGDSTDNQQMLDMRVGTKVTQTFDPKQGLYKLGLADGVELQCLVARGAGAAIPSTGPTCQVAKDGANRKTLPVAVIAGNQIANATILNYSGHKISAVFNKGGATDSQKLLWISFDGDYHQVFDPKRALYKFGNDAGIEIQCFNE